MLSRANKIGGRYTTSLRLSGLCNESTSEGTVPRALADVVGNLIPSKAKDTPVSAGMINLRYGQQRRNPRAAIQ